MTDENENSKPGDEGTPDVGGGLVSRLRGLLGGRNANENLRDTIEELIEQEDGDVDGESVDLTLFRNVLAVDASSSLADVAKLMSDSGHSRLPVFRSQLDDVIGMVHIKDLLACWEDDTGSRIDKIARKALFVAPSMPVLQLLLQMRSQRIHMAMVVDEFGGIDGLVTIEDLVEEIVGEIEDEHDEETKPKIVRKGDDILDIDARVEIEDLESEIGPLLTDEERDEDIDTVGGLVFYVAGRVPGRGEVIRHDSGLEFEILDADPRRIRRVRASKLPTRSEE